MSLLNTMGFATTVVLLICPCLGGKVTSGTESDALMADKLFLKFPTIYQVGAPKEPQPTNTLTNQGVANASQSWNDTVLVNGSTLTTPATTLDVEGGPISMSMSLSLTTATPKNNLISLDRPNFAVNAISSASSKPPMYIGSEAMYRKTKRNQTPHFGLRDNVASVSIIGKLSRNSIVAKETISNSLVLEQNTGSNSFVDGGSSSWRSLNSGQELNMNTQYTSGLVQLAHLEQSTGSSGPSGTLEKSVRRNVQSGNTEKIVGNNAQSGNSGQPYENNAQSGKLEQSTRRNVQTGRLAQLIGGNAVLLNTEQFNNATTPSLNPNQPIHGNTRVLLPVHEPYVNTSALPSKTVRPSYIPLQTLNPNTPVKASVHATNQGQSADVIAMPGITRQSAKNYINGSAQVVSTGPDVNTGAAIISAESLTASTTRGNTLQSVNTAQSGNSERSIQSTMPPVTTSNPKILSNSQEEEKNLKFENEEKSVILKLLNGYRKAVDSSLMYALRWNETLAAKAWLDVKDCDYKNKGNGAVQAMIHEKKTGTSMVSEAVSRWADEKNEFVLGVPCNYKNTCRYSQLVWADSQEVGCARQKCNDMSFISCMYSPPGNQAGRTAYIVGQPCSMCVGQCNTDHLCEWSRFPNTGAQPQQRFANPPMFQQPFF